MKDVAEPLELSATLAWRLAPALCRKDPVTGGDCSWYHGFWQLLRLMGLLAAPEVEAEFLRQAFAAVEGHGSAPRVLISGAADYSMLAHVLAEFRARNLDPEITLVDSCATPLHINRWYAERERCNVEVRQCDIFDYASQRPFDAVFAHSFFAYVPSERRPALVAKWHALLRPGGAVITVNRIRNGYTAPYFAFTETQARAFREAVLSRAEALRATLTIDPKDLAQMADVYARNQRLYPVRSPEELVDLFERGGFSIEHLSQASVLIPSRTDGDGPAASGERQRILARRV